MELRPWKTHESKMKLLRQNLFVSLFTAVLLVRGCSHTAAAANDPAADLDAFITRSIERIPGAGRGGRRRSGWQSDLAERIRRARRDQTRCVDENTIFQLASVTKTLTAAAAATVVDEGKLDWDKPIFNYLPEFVGYDPYMTRWLTERDLLAQRTGWPAYHRRPARQFWVRSRGNIATAPVLQAALQLARGRAVFEPGIFCGRRSCGALRKAVVERSR